MRKEGFNKIRALLTVICMLAGMLVTVGMPTKVYAVDAPWEGSGTEQNPYKISAAVELISVRDAVYSQYLGAYFVQTADIDLSGVENWEPIGTYDNPFTGNFDGKGHTILNIAINRPSSNEQGLFGFISGGGKLKDLHIEGAHVTGGVNVGILAGIIAEANGTTGNGTIENCSTSGTVNGTARIGGLIGSVQNGGAIVTGSFSMAAVTATGTSYSGSAGGLAGFLISGGTIQDSYATGTVHGYYAGGLVGDMNDSGSTIERSYAAGAVTGSNKSGGLVGNKGTGSVNDSFFDSVATGQSGSAGGTAKNTDKMQQQSTFTNWDFSSIWNISEDATYPFLRWQVTFAVTYDINGGTGTPPAASEVPAGVPFTTASTGSLTAPKGMQLKEWNTNADGTGTGYAAGATVTMPANDLSLYAIWEVSIIFDTPDTVIFGEPFDITVRVVDIYGDPVTDYTGTIVFKGAGNQPGLPETYTFTESDHGEKTFSDVVINYFGPFTLSVYEQSNQPDYYWEFDEGTGTATVDSVNDTSGTLYNTDSGVWVSGTPETNFTNPYAIKLDGSDDYIDAGTVDLANQSFTIAFWAKRSRGGQEWLISQGTGSTNQVLHIGFRSDSEFSFAFWGNDLNITALSYDTDWHHWTVTYDAATKTQKVFQDGSLLDTHQTTSDLISTGSLLIGKRFDGYHYGGSIDDLQVYLRALSPTEIETLADGNRSFLSASKVINIDASGQIPSLQLNMPQSVKAGEAFAAELTALDSEGGIINSINGPIPIYWSWDATTSPNGSNPVLAAAQANFSNGIASVDGFIPCKAGETITLTAEIAGTDARSSGTALVLPGRPWKLSIQKPAVMYMEKPFAVTVSILDRFENIVSDYIGKIALSGSDPGARLPEAYTFTESDLGVKEFSNIIFNEPGSFDLRAADISGELLGYWSFDEGQGNIVYDLSTNEKHGTGYNLGSGAWTSGPSAIQFNNPSAIQFDGSRYIVTPEGIDLANQPFTIAFWAKRSGVNNGWIVSQGIPETDQGLQIGLLYGGSSYKTKFVVDFYADGGNTAVAEDYGWHHWAVTYDPSTKRQTLYRDGVLLVSTTTNGNLQSSGPLLIGMRFDYGGFENYQGSLDDLRVYRQVLTKEYIEAMAAGHAEILYGKEVVAITPVAGALLDPSGTVYDLSAPGDISTTITWVSGESLEGIMNGEVPLQMGQDYTLSGDLLVISESYLSGLNQEEDQQISLSLRFDAGVDAVFTISIIDSSTYALTYDANGAAGTIPSGSNKVPGATFSAAAADSLIAPQGKQFKEWNTEYDRTGTGYLSGAIVTMPAKDLILYAIWEDIPGSTPSHIYFGNNGGSPILWRILEDNETEMFLLSEGALAWIKFDPDYDSIYDYGISIPRNWLAGDFLNSFTLKEQEAIRPQRVFDANNVATAVAEYAEGGDKFFLLSRDEALNATYFPGGDADRVLAPGALSDDWWLRTPKGNGFVYTVFYGGNIGEIYFYNSSWVRPAFKLNKESVLFTTAAGSSTPTVTDTLKAYSPPNAGSLQLTIKDSSRSLTVDSVTAQSLAKGSTVTVAYSNASVSDSSHLVVLLDNGVRKYYGVIKELTAGNESGTADFTLPAGMTTGDYTLKLWNEQFAGTNCTNYASEPVTGSITAPTYTVTYHANGGTGTAIVSNKAAGETFSAASPDGLTAPSGQQFKEWNTDSSGTGTGYRAETAVTMPAENLTLYAIWENINDNGGLNYNPGNRAITPNMIEFGGDLYVTWAEYADGHTQIRVKRFNGTTWSSADRGSLGQDAYNPVLCEFNGSLYLAWYEAPGSDKIYQVYIRKYEGGADWSSDVNLSYSNNKAFNVKLKVYDGMLYAVWVENNGTRNQIRAKKTSDGSTWSTADDLNNTVNYNSANHVTIPGIEVYDDALYAAWSEKGNIRAKKYDGTSWSTADSNTGLNYDGTKTAHVPVLLDGTSTLYLLWLEENEAGIYQVRAKKFNGTTWVEADNGSLNYDQSKGASMLTGFVHNGTIYAAWTEDGRVRIKSSQATGHTWTLADNGNVNYDAAKASSGLTFVEYQGQLYLSWKEDNGTTDQIRLKVH